MIEDAIRDGRKPYPLEVNDIVTACASEHASDVGARLKVNDEVLTTTLTTPNTKKEHDIERMSGVGEVGRAASFVLGHESKGL